MLRMFFTFLLTFSYGQSLAQDDPSVMPKDETSRTPEYLAGETLYQSKCITCHGKMGQGIKSQQAPRLRGQFDWYILSSLQKFVNNERKNPKMRPYLKGLTEEDFKILQTT